MQGKRYSRGNVAVAALLFVTFIGVAAMTLDSVRSVHARSQVAQAPTAESGKTDGQKEQVCELGYDYVVRFDTQTKQPTIKPTFGGNDAKPIDNKVQANQCQNPNNPPVGRVCTAAGWKCRVWFCTPKELTEGGEKEMCSLRSSDGIVGKGVANTDAYKSAMAASAKDLLGKINDPARVTSITKSVGEFGLSKSVLDAFGGQQRVDQLNYEIFRSEEQLQKLREHMSATCGTAGFELECGTVRDEVTAEEKRLADLRKESAILKESQASLIPTTPDATGRGPEVLACVKNASGVCVNDSRTNPGYQAPPTTFDRTPPGGCAGGTNCGPSGQGTSNTRPPNSNSSSGNLLSSLGQFMPLLTGLAQGFFQKGPSCSITASPQTISQPGQPVTLSWRSENAQSAYLSLGGQVGPSGSITINPQQTTTISMQVVGFPQQQQQQQQQGYNPYGAQQQGQYVWNAQLGAYVYIQGQPQQQQNPLGQLGQQIGQAIGGGGGQQQAQCQTQVTVGQNTGGGGGGGTTSDKPKAQISCQPKIVDVGMSVSISYACQNSTTSKGDGFSTSDKLSGSATAEISSPEKGSTTVTYGLTCTKEGATDSAQCTVNVNKPSIVFVANPKNVKAGERTNIGWVTGAMESCVVSSPDLSEFTEANKNNTSTSGSAKTPPLTQNTAFVVTCTTKAGGTKKAETTVEVGN